MLSYYYNQYVDTSSHNQYIYIVILVIITDMSSEPRPVQIDFPGGKAENPRRSRIHPPILWRGVKPPRHPMWQPGLFAVGCWRFAPLISTPSPGASCQFLLQPFFDESAQPLQDYPPKVARYYSQCVDIVITSHCSQPFFDKSPRPLQDYPPKSC